MVRRSLGVALWTVVGLLACCLGALSALVSTGAGRALVARVTEDALRRVFTGSVEVGDVHGTLLTGVSLSQVRLFDADTTLVAWLPRADVSYNPLDFAAGRVVRFERQLRQPVINIVQHPGGRLNVEELLRLGGGTPDTGRPLPRPHGPATLILFRKVRIDDGTITLRLQAARSAPGDTALEIQSGGVNGRLRIRRFEHVDARFAALQISAPRERGIRIDLTRLAVEASDPPVRLVDVAGRLRVVGDSLELNVARARLPASALRDARGVVTWPHGTILYDLQLRADSAFRDSVVPGWPESRIRGRGEVNLKATNGIHFQPFAVEASSVDFGTIRRLVPAARLHGMLYATGTLTGPLRNAQFSGALAHKDGDRPPSKIAGTVRLDGRGDTLGIYADVSADSVSFDGLRGSFPDLPLQGAVAGPVKLAGTLRSLETHADLRGPGGALEGNGVLALDLPHYGARGFVLRARDLDLARWTRGRGTPDSRLTFSVDASVTGDSAVPPAGTLRAALGPSFLAGSPLDSGAALLRFADRRVYVDSLRVAQPGLITTGSGSLGWTRGTRGTLALDFDADSLSSVDSLVAWITGAGGTGAGPGEAGTAAADPPGDEGREGAEMLSGSARVALMLQGALDSLGLEARASGERVKWRGWELTSGRARLAWQPGPTPAFAVEAMIDSLAHGVLGP